MAYDEALGDRVRTLLADEDDLSERRMFGGLAFMLGGHMCAGILGDELMVRVGPDGHDAAVASPHVREMDFTGQPMRGMVLVGPEAVRTAADLRAWLGRGVAFVRTLPPKPGRNAGT